MPGKCALEQNNCILGKNSPGSVGGREKETESDSGGEKRGRVRAERKGKDRSSVIV